MTTTLPTFNQTLETAVITFKKVFNANPDVASCAPGRVNLIGEHIDYNDGYVLPMALPMVTIIVGKVVPNSNIADILTCCDGADDPRRIQFQLDNVTPGLPRWANYIKGVIHGSAGMVAKVPGFNAVIMTNVPVGGGLSSSAALEMSTLTFLEALSPGKSTLTLTDKALICQKAEHEFAGMPCGIMDQLISVMGKQKHALLIDCQSLATQQIPFSSDDLAILICNSNVRHELSDSEYPTRRKQCAEALSLMNLTSFRDAKLDNLSALKNSDEVLIKRARHVITEIQRTYEAAEALKGHNFEQMGKLMTESHLSLRDDFQVSCKELDILVEAANKCSGVLGSRMTGGGFGGCTVTLVRKIAVADVIHAMQTEYGKYNCTASFYVCEPADGARLINLK
ncbi:galactokinase-like isoform X1 [Bradysia coprophila]|uniref:galactokinase-like isoform X1 n=1 Tax=Bradysia coprophila TaxID=38358 RepID=UPI00187DA2AF|nr:galactokinase-like isoform X1 [Bradysia coprophila]